MQPENQCSLLCEREKSQKVPQGSVDATGNLSQVLPAHFMARGYTCLQGSLTSEGLPNSARPTLIRSFPMYLIELQGHIPQLKR